MDTLASVSYGLFRGYNTNYSDGDGIVDTIEKDPNAGTLKDPGGEAYGKE